MRFRPEQHLRRQNDFRDAREKGRSLACGAFILWHHVRSTPGPGPRVGVIASTAAVGGAVQRNRAKRRLREIFRHHQHLVPPDRDLLLIARSAVNRLDYALLAQKFSDACRRLFPPAP